MSEPKKETVRITLPPRPVPDPRAVASAKATGRISLPPKPTVGGGVPRPVVARPVVQAQAPMPATMMTVAEAPAVPRPSAPLPQRPPATATVPTVPRPAAPMAVAPAPVPAAHGVPRPAAPVPRPSAPVPVAVAKVPQPAAGDARIEVAPPGVASAAPRPVPRPLTKSGTARIDAPAEPSAPRAMVARVSAPTVRIEQIQPLRELPGANIKPLTLAAVDDEEDASTEGIAPWVAYSVFACSLLACGVQLWTFFGIE